LRTVSSPDELHAHPPITGDDPPGQFTHYEIDQKKGKRTVVAVAKPAAMFTIDGQRWKIGALNGPHL
jgi:hypothetical protein